MEDESPDLSVGFLIDTGSSYDALIQLQRAMDSAEGKIIQDAAAIERATSGMLNLAGSTAQVQTFGNTVSREMKIAAQEKARAERAGERLSRQMEREAQTFGLSRAQIRAVNVETAALAAEQAGLTELSERLRGQLAGLAARQEAAAAAAAQEAQALRDAAFAHQMFEARVKQGVVAMREREAAERAAAAAEADLAARAQRLIEQVNPAVAAQNRFNTEMKEARTLISAGAISLDDYVEKLRLERTALETVASAHGRGAASAGQLRVGTQQLSYQIGDFATQVSLGSGVAQAFAAQLGQTVQAVQLMSGSTKGFIGFMSGPWGAVISGAVIILGTLAAKYFDGADAAREKEAAAKALTQQMDQLYEANMRAVKSEQRLQQEALNTANSMWQQAEQTRLATVESLKLAKARLVAAQQNQQGGAGSIAGTVASVGAAQEASARSEIARLDALLAANSTEVRKMRDGFKAAQIPVLQGIVSEMDAATASTRAFGRATDALNDKFMASSITTSEYTREYGKLKSAYDAEQKTLQASGRAHRTRAAALSDEQRAYENATKAAQDYAAAQVDEAAKLGLNAKELRLYADAAAIAKAPTDALKKSIADAATAREKAYSVQNAKDFEANVMKPLRDELALYGLTGPARDLAALGLEKEAFLAKNMGDGIAVATARWEEYYRVKSGLIGKDAAAALEADQIQRMNEALVSNAELWDAIARNAQNAARGMADAFGDAGAALGDLSAIYADFRAEQTRQTAEHARRMTDAGDDEIAQQREIARNAAATSTMQIGLYGDLAAAAKGFFNEKSTGYKAVMAAEKVFRAFEFAMSVRAMVQDVAETVSSVTNSAARATAAGTEGIAEQSKLPFPLNIAAMAATGAALIAAGVAVIGSFGGGGKNTLTPANNGTGTVLGDADAQSESIRRGIDALKEVDTVMLSYSREMAASLRSIESQIGGFASLLVRNADSINASGGITEGFKPNIIGSVLGSIPLVGGILKGLFGSKTTVIGSGLYGGAQSLGDILASGFDASYYSDIKKKKKFFGLTTSTKYSTQYTGADAALENQFTLILREFNDAILAASGPLGAATTDIENRLKGFVVNIGKIDLQGLTGAEIEEKLQAVFGAAADDMAEAAFPGLQKFQKVGEGAFETLVRVASVVESVTARFDQLGIVTTGMSVDVKMAVADQFDSIGDLTGAVQTYFEAFYTPAEQAAAKAAQMGQVFDSLGLSMPATLDGFRALVEAQDLTTAAGRETWAALIQLAPAFADLKSAMEGAKSAADILAERQDLERKLLEVQGKTAELRALELAKLDPSNRALQEQIWAIQDAQEAAKAADELRKAWESVGTSIMDEVKRIRGLSDAAGGTSYAALLGQFNAATSAAAGGDIDAAKSLPQLSQALLTAAANAATSRQELDRIRAQTAASLEAVYGLIGGFTDGASGTSDSALLDAAASGQASIGAANDNGTQSLSAKLDALREELERLRADNNSGHAATAANTGAIKRTMADITSENGGNAVSVAVA